MWEAFFFNAEEISKYLYLYLTSTAADIVSISYTTINDAVHRVFCTWGKKNVSELVKRNVWILYCPFYNYY